MVGRLPETIEIVALHDKLGRFPLVLWDEFRSLVHARIDAAIRRLAANPDLGSDAEPPPTLGSTAAASPV